MIREGESKRDVGPHPMAESADKLHSAALMQNLLPPILANVYYISGGTILLIIIVVLLLRRR